MADTLKVGDRVGWNSEAASAARSFGCRDFDVKGYTHHASTDAPQYEIKSSKTEHIAFHKGSALTKLRD